MDRPNEKHAGSGYLTQVSVGWEPRFNFNPLKSPPNFSILGIFRSFLGEIDKLSPSDLKFVTLKISHQKFISRATNVSFSDLLDTGYSLMSSVPSWKM